MTSSDILTLVKVNYHTIAIIFSKSFMKFHPSPTKYKLWMRKFIYI